MRNHNISRYVLPLASNPPPQNTENYHSPPIPTPTRTSLPQVICINISKRQNDLNNSLNKAAGLQGKISIPGEKSFFDTGLPDSSCDVVCSQDSFCHAGSARHKALEEASRLLKPGGRMVFTDFMQTEEADDKDLEGGGLGGGVRYPMGIWIPRGMPL